MVYMQQYICKKTKTKKLFAKQIKTKSPINEYIHAAILGLTMASKARAYAILENGFCNWGLLYT